MKRTHILLSIVALVLFAVSCKQCPECETKDTTTETKVDKTNQLIEKSFTTVSLTKSDSTQYNTPCFKGYDKKKLLSYLIDSVVANNKEIFFMNFGGEFEKGRLILTDQNQFCKVADVSSEFPNDTTLIWEEFSAQKESEYYAVQELCFYEEWKFNEDKSLFEKVVKAIGLVEIRTIFDENTGEEIGIRPYYLYAVPFDNEIDGSYFLLQR